MRLYIAKPGQTLAGGKGGEIPPRTPLTAIGRAAAAEIGKRLQAEGFRGRILSAPTRRAMETAAGVAGITGSSGGGEAALGGEGEEIEALLGTLLARNEDVLLVGDGPLASVAKRVLKLEHYRSVTGWYASLSCLDTETGESYIGDVSHLPPALRTSPTFTWKDAERMAGEAISDAIGFFAENFGTRVLHIGDTYSHHYEFYRRLIAATRPEVIVHTGDMAVELKAGRIEKDVPSWEETVLSLWKILKESGARVILVPGNNDVPSYMEKNADFAEIYPPTTVIELGGKQACIAHSVQQLEAEAEFYLYGHGLTGETRTREENTVDGRRYFNSFWGVSLHDFEGGRHLIVDNPRF